MNVLVVGGAGYIGSHCVRQLSAAGHRPVVLDSLVYGHRAAVAPEVPFHVADLGDESGRRRHPPRGEDRRRDALRRLLLRRRVGHRPAQVLSQQPRPPRFTCSTRCLGPGCESSCSRPPARPSGCRPRCRSPSPPPRRRSIPTGRRSSTSRTRCGRSPTRGRSRSRRSGISTPRAPPRTARSARTTIPRPTSSPSPSTRRPASAPASSFSARTTPPPTARACATTSTWTTSAGRTSPCLAALASPARPCSTTWGRDVPSSNREVIRAVEKATGRRISVDREPAPPGRSPGPLRRLLEGAQGARLEGQVSRHRLDRRHGLELAPHPPERVRRLLEALAQGGLGDSRAASPRPPRPRSRP
jgi:hypothetical protein